MNNFYPFINPIQWFKARRFARESKKYDKSSFDLELSLYSKILTNNLLHYGYFQDPTIKPEDISFNIFENAQHNYCLNIIEQINNNKDAILDVGCGMGGFAKILKDKQFNIEVLTPNQNQIDYIKKSQPELVNYKCKFEDFASQKEYGTIINSESLQYIDLNTAFEKVEKHILPDGRWIIVDYFRLHDNGKSKSAHLLVDFKSTISAKDWEIVYEKDITPNILPTLNYIKMYTDRFLDPLKHFGFEKLRFKKPKLYYLSTKLRASIDRKLEKEMAAVDPAMFANEKKYILFVLEKKK